MGHREAVFGKRKSPLAVEEAFAELALVLELLTVQQALAVKQAVLARLLHDLASVAQPVLQVDGDALAVLQVQVAGRARIKGTS